MGASRSTAAMLTLLAPAYPEEGEERLFTRLREIRPQAWPNSLMVGYAAELLGRGGRLTAARSGHYGPQIRPNPTTLDGMARVGRSSGLARAGTWGRPANTDV